MAALDQLRNANASEAGLAGGRKQNVTIKKKYRPLRVSRFLPRMEHAAG
ncbi:hypothetical protein [Salipiger sp.]